LVNILQDYTLLLLKTGMLFIRRNSLSIRREERMISV